MGNVYFFQNADGDFVVGNNTSEVYPGGQYRPLIEKINGVDCFGIAYLDNANAVVSPRAATYFLKQNGTAYADIAEIMTACKAFFTTTKVTMSSSNGTLLYPAGKPVRLKGTFNRPANTDTYAAGDAIGNSISAATAMVFDKNAAIENGGGGKIIGAHIESNIVELSGLPIKIYLYSTTPGSVPNDNAAFNIAAGNNGKRCYTLTLNFGVKKTGENIVYAEDYPVIIPYVCDSKSLFALFELPNGCTTPTSGGYINLVLDVDIQS